MIGRAMLALALACGLLSCVGTNGKDGMAHAEPRPRPREPAAVVVRGAMATIATTPPPIASVLAGATAGCLVYQQVAWQIWRSRISAMILRAARELDQRGALRQVAPLVATPPSLAGLDNGGACIRSR